MAVAVDATRTIEQLSAETAMTVRNIRSYRTLGLIPAPEVRDGVGYYGDEHVRRLRLVRELQADGFNLRGIKQLLDAAHDSGVLLRLRRLMHTPSPEATTQIVTREELEGMIGAADEPGLLESAVAAGILVPLDDGRYEAVNALTLRIAVENIKHGIPLSAALDCHRRVQELCAQIAEAQVEVFVEHVWRPFERAGYPEERWSDIAEAIEELRPLSAEGTMAIYGPIMADVVERTLGDELRRVSGE